MKRNIIIQNQKQNVILSRGHNHTKEKKLPSRNHYMFNCSCVSRWEQWVQCRMKSKATEKQLIKIKKVLLLVGNEAEILIIFWGWRCCYRCCYFLANLSLNVVIKKVVTQPSACTCGDINDKTSWVLMKVKKKSNTKSVREIPEDDFFYIYIKVWYRWVDKLTINF